MDGFGAFQTPVLMARQLIEIGVAELVVVVDAEEALASGRLALAVLLRGVDLLGSQTMSLTHLATGQVVNPLARLEEGCRSGAAAHQEKQEEHRKRHAEEPQDRPAGLARLRGQKIVSPYLHGNLLVTT
jgi:hypothetical protein